MAKISNYLCLLGLVVFILFLEMGACKEYCLECKVEEGNTSNRMRKTSIQKPKPRTPMEEVYKQANRDRYEVFRQAREGPSSRGVGH